MQTPFNELPMLGWYPRHMLKAGEQMRERLKLVDLIVEILDARLPPLSQNPEFDRLFGQKPRFRLFNKGDLVPEAFATAWREHFRNEGVPCAFVDSLHGDQRLKSLPDEWTRFVERQRRERGATRTLYRPIRVMVAGVPNVGKSTLINRLVASRRTRVGPRPGITRAQEWIRLPDGTELLDTPGVMWPAVHDKDHELRLGLAGAIKDDLLGEELLAEFLLEAVLRPCAEKVDWALYGLDAPPAAAHGLLTAVGQRRGLLKPGGTVDTRQAAIILLKDFRDAKLGRITLTNAPL